MEYAKKLMLVEPKLFRPSMREKTLSRLDEEIEKALSSDLPDNEKAAKYISALQKYLYYETPNKPVEEKTSESDVLNTVSSTQRHKAKRILEHLKSDSSFKINDGGEISYNQQKISKSHLGDLLNDLLKKKSTEEPPGWQQFSNSLKSLDIPKSLVENPDRWNYMHPVIKKGKKKTKKTSPAVSIQSFSPSPRRGGRRRTQPRWLDFDNDS